MTTRTVGELAELVQGEVTGDRDCVISDGESFDRAKPDHVTFAHTGRTLRRIAECRAGCIVVGRTVDATAAATWNAAACIQVDDPQLAFLQILSVLRPKRQRRAAGISPQADVSPSAVIGAGTIVHPRVTVSEGVRIGENCEIFPGVFLGAGSVIGNDVVLRPNAVVYHDVQIGHRAVIGANSVIGSDGYGYKLRNGRHERIPHFGIVRIEDDVEIGACTTVDRAVIGETVIGEGTKIDNLVMIAHNCELGRHNLVVGQAGFAGSVTTGDYVVCAGQAGIADHVHLGTKSVVGSQCGVHRDIPESTTVLGTPALPAAEARPVYLSLRKIPTLLRTVRTLTADMKSLKQRLEIPPGTEQTVDCSAA